MKPKCFHRFQIKTRCRTDTHDVNTLKCQLCGKLKVTRKKHSVSRPIKKQSDKRKKEGKEYSKLRAEFFTSNPLCQADLMGCTRQATEIHHKARRGVFYLDHTTFMACCSTCHEWIERNGEESKRMGFILDREALKRERGL